jgi:hypothetical protein
MLSRAIKDQMTSFGCEKREIGLPFQSKAFMDSKLENDTQI